MSDDLDFASPDEYEFGWPKTESRRQRRGRKGSGWVKRTKKRLVEAGYGWGCYYCARPFTDFKHSRRSTIDHIIPISRKGTNNIDNLVLACDECNTAKRGMLIEEWRPEWRPHDYFVQKGLVRGKAMISADGRVYNDNRNWKFGGPQNREQWVGEWVVYRRWMCRWTWAAIGREINCTAGMAKTIFEEVKGHG